MAKHFLSTIFYYSLLAVSTILIEVKGTSAGGGYSNAADLHKFSMALMAGKLVSPQILALITKGKMAMPGPMLPPNAKPMPETKYGYGFGEVYKNEVRIFGHYGGAPGVEAHLSIFPDWNCTLVVLCNYDMIVVPMVNRFEEILTEKK